MSSLPEINCHTEVRPRYADVAGRKLTGSTYTPSELATFVATKIAQAYCLRPSGKIRVLDPAVGDGALLQALIEVLPVSCHHRLQVVGYDTDSDAIRLAGQGLRSTFPELELRLENEDFLDHVIQSHAAPDLFAQTAASHKFDIVIANPPYVRTQVMGASQAQQLSRHFGLSGRVDLYYPFLLAISRVLTADGVAGIITSNRFMTTKSGQSVRAALLSRFRVLQAWDLGDTKLFDAAVLPAVILARGGGSSAAATTTYSSIYQTKDVASANAAAPLVALSADDDTVVAVADGRHFRVRHGLLDNGGDPEGVWRVATRATDGWLATVQAKSWSNFRRIGKTRVGVKSTADKVFIRSDWDEKATAAFRCSSMAGASHAEISSCVSLRRSILAWYFLVMVPVVSSSASWCPLTTLTRPTQSSSRI